MMAQTYKISLFALSCVILSCLISTMALFMGGGQGGTDLRALLQLQAVSIPLGILAVVFVVFLAGGGAASDRLKQLYSMIPQWLIFIAIMLNLLVASGEIALLIVARAMQESVPWTAHVPLISMMTSSLAFCVLFGQSRLLSGHTEGLSGRWGP